MDFYDFNGFVELSVVSTDGVNAYDIYPTQQQTLPSFADAGLEHLIFNGPPDGNLGTGRQVGDLAAFTCPVKRWWEVKGSNQTFYVEDITYFSDGSGLVKEEMRTSGGKTTHDPIVLVTSTYEFAIPEYGVRGLPGTFDVPYL
jgi:hypothetical protein